MKDNNLTAESVCKREFLSLKKFVFPQGQGICWKCRSSRGGSRYKAGYFLKQLKAVSHRRRCLVLLDSNKKPTAVFQSDLAPIGRL